MRKFFVNIFMVWLAVQAGAKELEWLTSLPEAQKKAKEEKKIMLLDFTGSDWCGWCIKLKREIFDTPEFVDYAAKNLVLMEVDFPMRKEQSAEQKRANAALQAKYGVKGYPTIVILDREGKQLGQLGYMQGGPQPFITRLNKFKAKAVASSQ